MNRTESSFLEKKKIKTVSYFDFTLLFLVLFISLLGLIFIYSSSSYIAQIKNLKPTYFVSRQAMVMGVSFVIMLLPIFIPYRAFLLRFKQFPKIGVGTILIFIAYALQIAVLVMEGAGRNGSNRWLPIPGIGTFQPSEFSKFAIIIYISIICYRKTKDLDNILSAFMATWIVLPLIGLIAIENLSSAVIVFAIYLSICFVTSKKYFYFIVVVIVCIFLLITSIQFFGGYRNDRIKAWKSIETEEKGYQILQGLYAIASGGILGSGIGNSVGKFNKIPEAYNDMIFTIICEEHGLVGGVLVLLLYVLLVFKIFYISVNSPDLFGSLIAVGVMTQIAVQAILNVAVVTNMVPSTGVILPFISFGGSSLLMLYIEIGVVLNIAKQIKYYA